MNRLYFLLTVMVVMLGALFATHEALAKVLTGTGGKDRLLGTDRDNRASRVATGRTTSRAAAGPTTSGVAAAKTRCTPAPTVSTCATQAGWIT
jgi:hypothetical protein